MTEGGGIGRVTGAVGSKGERGVEGIGGDGGFEGGGVVVERERSVRDKAWFGTLSLLG